VDFGGVIRAARLGAELSQSELAERSATSQATLSAYERGHKIPSAATLVRVLAATGNRLTVEAARPVVTPSAASLERSGRKLAQVLELAAVLPTRHEREIKGTIRRAGGPN
jgi:transcriptional regulator with XRE-family HTH domain